MKHAQDRLSSGFFPAIALALFALLLVREVQAAGTIRGHSIGYDLTYALNGSLKYVETVTDAAVGTLTFSASIPDGADVYIQCPVDTYYINLASGDSNAVITKAPKVLADVLQHVGVLTRGVSQIGFDTTGASSACKIFQAY
jgi:hypothetical protein